MVPLVFSDDKVPLLLITKYDGVSSDNAAKRPVASLPYVKLDCATDPCSITKWRNAELENLGGTGYYSFLDPGLAPASIRSISLRVLRRYRGS